MDPRPHRAGIRPPPPTRARRGCPHAASGSRGPLPRCLPPPRGGMKRSRHFSRSPTLPMNHGSEVVRARRYLQQRGWPRLQMALIVVLTGAAGFLASNLLRLAGIDAMLLRCPMAVVLAYGVFLLLVWIWIRWRWATYWRDCRRMWAVAAHRLACRACRNRDGGGYACRIRSGRCSACCCFSPYWAGSRRNACRVRAICCRSSRGGVRLAPSYRLDPPRFQLH